VTGYLLEMKDRRNLLGTFEVVFDGSDVYPDILNFYLNDERVVPGNSYIFRVKAKYLNGYTAYSEESLPIWACLPPRNLDPIRLIAVNSNEMSFEWSQPQFKGSCDLQGFALFMDSGNGVLTEIDSA